MLAIQEILSTPAKKTLTCYVGRKEGAVLAKYIINGGRELSGEVTISGAKNAVVAILPACVLIEGPCIIENVPRISDVTYQLEILKKLGASVKLINATTIEIDCSKLRTSRALYDDLMRKSRASYYYLGALLGRFSTTDVAMPGGCDFGVRPIDQHIKGFEALGAKVDVKGGVIHAEAAGGLRANHVYFDMTSVGATINVMLAAARTKGLTILENAAKEPHIVDVANFLNSAGADIKGAGTDVIKIRGVEKLHGVSYSIIPDQIEAGTFLAAVAAVGGQIKLNNVIPKHLECIYAKFSEMGVEMIDLDDAVVVRRIGRLERTNIKTMPYPGFPTDMNPQAAVALCLAGGTSTLKDSIWPNRFKYVDELKRMGAHIRVDESTAIIEGIDHLTGAPVRACDLRAGAALIIAGMAAHGVTEVSNIVHIERGYENIVEKFRSIGADITRVETPDVEMQEAN